MTDQSLAQHILRFTGRIRIGSVHEIDAAVDRGIHNGLCRGFVHADAEGHGAQANLGYTQAAAT